MIDQGLDALAVEKVLGRSRENIWWNKRDGLHCAPLFNSHINAQSALTGRELSDLLEDEIERRGLLDGYAAALLSMKTESGYIQGDHAFLIRATPAQRRDAALKVAGNL